MEGGLAWRVAKCCGLNGISDGGWKNRKQEVASDFPWGSPSSPEEKEKGTLGEVSKDGGNGDCCVTTVKRVEKGVTDNSVQ